MTQGLTVILYIIPLILIIALICYWIATNGRKLSLPEEVTKGVKSDTPFPSHISSNASKYDYRYINSSNNSSVVNINETQYLPSDFKISDNTYIVRREFVPKSVDELPIKRNEILSVKEIFEDGWCMAISVNSGEMGVVPLQCLYKYSDLLKKKKIVKMKQKEQMQKEHHKQKNKQYKQQYKQQEKEQIDSLLVQNSGVVQNNKYSKQYTSSTKTNENDNVNNNINDDNNNCNITITNADQNNYNNINNNCKKINIHDNDSDTIKIDIVEEKKIIDDK